MPRQFSAVALLAIGFIPVATAPTAEADVIAQERRELRFLQRQVAHDRYLEAILRARLFRQTHHIRLHRHHHHHHRGALIRRERSELRFLERQVAHDRVREAQLRARIARQQANHHVVHHVKPGAKPKAPNVQRSGKKK